MLSPFVTLNNAPYEQNIKNPIVETIAAFWEFRNMSLKRPNITAIPTSAASTGLIM